MTDLELAEEIERKLQVSYSMRPNSQRSMLLDRCEWQQIIAALRGRPEHDKEIGEFQQSVYAICEKFYPEVDGAGSDTGDWRDFTLAEIRQTLNHLAERPSSGEMEWTPTKGELEFARGIVAAEGFYTQAAITVAKALLRLSAAEASKEAK